MCGINGFITKKKLSDSKYRIEKMNKAIKHRGPDASGSIEFDDGKVSLGHCRLSIIDLDARADQPMRSDNKETVIVYNGEIYNYKELKATLNYSFKTGGDTEVLLAGLDMEGMKWIQKCNGMFAFAYYDNYKKRLFLARDRMGIKPLYYYKDEEVFVFSSEIKGILNSGLVKADFNYNAIDEYLGNRFVREPYTFFKKIYQIPAGHYLIMDENFEVKIEKYWELPKIFNQRIEYNEKRIYQEFKEEVISAIQKRLIADVKVGTYLSGGIDSGIISAITALNSNQAIDTYTVGFEELNEFKYARLVSQKYKTLHHEIIMDKQKYFLMMEELIRYKDAPLGVPNEVALAIMSKELKEKITVVLSGEGADELLGGYGKIFRSPFDYKNIDNKKEIEFYDYFIEKYEYVPRRIRDSYLDGEASLRNEFDEIIRKEFQRVSNEESVFRFFHNYHVKGLLQRVDTTTMYAGVEARVPFLDHKLIEYSYNSIPYELKIKWKSENAMRKAKLKSSNEYSEQLDEPKYLLRRLGREFLPHAVVSRKKMGFPVPLDSWKEELEKLARNILRESDWLKKDCLENLIEDCNNSYRSSQILWMFINIELFRKQFFDKEWRY